MRNAYLFIIKTFFLFGWRKFARSPQFGQRLAARIFMALMGVYMALVSSHNLNHVAEISTRIVLLEKGKAIRDVRHVQVSGNGVLQDLESYFAVEV